MGRGVWGAKCVNYSQIIRYIFSDGSPYRWVPSASQAFLLLVTSLVRPCSETNKAQTLCRLSGTNPSLHLSPDFFAQIILTQYYRHDNDSAGSI